MTLQQLKYAISVAESGSFNEAAKMLFISQPSLSNAIKELEMEVGLTLFARSSRGVMLSADGEEFLGYARQTVLQMELLEEKYLSGKKAKQRFSVSTHHYLFAANAYVELIKEYGGDEYEFTYRETRTHDVIDDVRNLRSEIGLIYLSKFNEAVINKLLKESEIVFHQLFKAQPHVFLNKKHPLARERMLRIEQLDEYPYLTFEQGEHNSFYFSEEVINTRIVKKSIKMSDRAAMVNFMIGLDGYTVCSGVFPEYLHGADIISVPLDSDEVMRVGYITRKGTVISKIAETYIEALTRIARELYKSTNKN